MHRRQTGCRTVARLPVIVAQQLPGIQLAADDAQQVVAEDLAVGSPDDERLIAGGRGLRQHVGTGQRAPAVGGATLLPVVGQLAVAAIDGRQHSVVDGLQGDVRRCRLALLQPLHGG